ncbi:tagatose-6-phosphate ketose isomerase [Virgibacillus phasianinus]|uniref:Tagatose-6-phosphate ketose isomerase n=1 Tax=Virgibacillus phasianinus TaxID=2017483 RepID=A0A220U338_9BACI|nr:SIS domain-containing protein [Virgibacillus phasianinus]ASK62231.1 tagatose-6-phosphate ketose isomerase [Virgibacillus phasianinus]
MLNLTNEILETRSAVHTAREIYQQPDVWQELFALLAEQEVALKDFIESIYKKHDQVRVIFTGAGTSAFAGDTVVPELRRQNSNAQVQFESIATTDIVSNPTTYLHQKVPTIMVSFARSGNSPESVAAVSLGEELIQQFYQVVITCNQEGQLAKNVKGDTNSMTVVMPEDVHDQGFAMTSSFTSMVIAAYALFAEESFTIGEAKQLIESAAALRDLTPDTVDDILNFDFERIVYLGSGLLGQLSHEASLKMLELSAGQVTAIHESSLGFRHGPKSILNDKSVTVLFMSQDPYTRKYDVDILRELAADDSGMKIVALTEKKDLEVEALADWMVTVNDGYDRFANDFQLAVVYIIFAQTLALKKSLQLGITPDNPSPDGRVNRVVQGVTIYDYE